MSGGPRTPEEADRLARARESLGELPEGVEVDLVFMDADEEIRRIHESDAAVFVPAKGYGYAGDDARTPLVEIDVGWLEQAVAAGRVSCRHYGIANALAGVPMPVTATLRLVVDGVYETPIYVRVDEGPEGFVDEAIERGLYFVFPRRADGVPRVYMWIPPMRRFDEPTVIPSKIGRNDPCPCGSGVKFKRCHGR